MIIVSRETVYILFLIALIALGVQHFYLNPKRKRAREIAHKALEVRKNNRGD